MPRPATLVGLCVVFGITTGGATCTRRPSTPVFPPPPPVSFSPAPTLSEVAAAVNRTDDVSMLSTTSATVRVASMPKLPKLRATVHARRERDFRLKADLPVVLGSGIDLGSNADRFWFETPERLSRTLYWSDHHRFRHTGARTVLPVDPTWFMQAMGLARVNPDAVIAGPMVRSDGLLEIRENVPMPGGDHSRVLYVEPEGGYVTDQWVINEQNLVVARSEARGHVYYPIPGASGGTTGCVLPHHVRIHLTPPGGQEVELEFDIARYTINQLLSGDANLFVMPTTAANRVDLASNFVPPVAQRPSVYSRH